MCVSSEATQRRRRQREKWLYNARTPACTVYRMSCVLAACVFADWYSLSVSACILYTIRRIAARIEENFTVFTVMRSGSLFGRKSHHATTKSAAAIFSVRIVGILSATASSQNSHWPRPRVEIARKTHIIFLYLRMNDEWKCSYVQFKIMKTFPSVQNDQSTKYCSPTLDLQLVYNDM